MRNLYYDSHVQPVLMIALVFVVLTAYPGFALAGNDSDTGTLVVSGTGTVSAPPDVVYFTVAVETVAATAAEAQTENARLMKDVMDQLRAKGLDDDNLQTAGFHLAPQWRDLRQAQDAREIVGYRATHRVAVTLHDVEQAGAVIDAVLAGGANSVSGVRFGLVNEVEWRNQALALAVADARGKAETLAGAAGLVLGPVQHIRESGTGATMAQESFARQDLMMVRAETSLEAGTIEVRAQVEMVYGI